MYLAVRPLVGSLVLGLAALAGCSSSASTVSAPVTSNFGASGFAAHPHASPAAPVASWSHTYTQPQPVARASHHYAKSPQLSYVAGATPLPPAPRAIAPIEREPIRASIAKRDIRVMTFNLRVSTIFDGANTWGLRKGMVVERIRACDPDMIGTQEGLNTQEKFLQAKLPDYTFFGAGRNDGKRSGEMCGVFFKSANFEQIGGGHFWLSTTPKRPGSKSWGAPFPRMVTWVKLRPRDGGQTFCWFNTHFEAFSERARQESARLLQQQIASIAGGMPCIVTGDFNAGDASKPYQRLVSNAAPGAVRLVDAYRSVNRYRPGGEEGTRHSFSGEKDGERIDWILISPHFQAIAATIDHSRGLLGYPSDHFPVVATLRLIAAPAYPMARIE